MPTLFTIHTAIVPLPVSVKLGTMPGNITNLGINVTSSDDRFAPDVMVFNNYSLLLGVVSTEPYLWNNGTNSFASRRV